jgi:propionyl-CoA carboxylase beta chain
MRATQLKGVVPQFCVVNGEVYGSVALLAAIADFSFFIENKSVLAINSPLVMSAKAGKNLTKEEVGGAKAIAKTGVPSFVVSDLEQIKGIVYEITEILGAPVIDADLNECFPSLNENPTAGAILSIFEHPVEVGALTESEVKTVLGRIGGIAVAAIVFDGGEDGVLLNTAKVQKIADFTEFASCYQLPLIVFGDVKGIVPCVCTNDGKVMKSVAEYLNVLDTIDTAKIAVVYKQAIGLGYSLFASKSVGFDYTCAFANAKISLFDDVQGAKLAFEDDKTDMAALKERYSDEHADPINAAKCGYIDAVIEPQFVKQHLIASLQMLTK